MRINRGIPPVRLIDSSTMKLNDLLERNRNLKRLLRLIKNHVIYDEKLYKEILEALKTDN